MKNRVQTIHKTGEESSRGRLNGFQRLKECCFILGTLTAIFLAVSLYSFSPADPSWSQTSWGSEVNNAAGTFGAWIADTLLFGFGSLAYILPVVIGVLTWGLFRNRADNDFIDPMLWGTRILGLCLIILTSCGLADINFDDFWYFSSGGVIGDVLTSLALPTLNLLGSTLVFLFFWGAGFTLLSGISWLSVVEGLGSTAIKASTWLLNRLRGTPKERLYSVEPYNQEDGLVTESMLSTPYVTVPPVQHEPQERRYNIHLPQKGDSHEVNEETREIARSQKLYTTIAELEQDAIAQDDLAISVSGNSVSGNSISSNSASDNSVSSNRGANNSLLNNREFLHPEGETTEKQQAVIETQTPEYKSGNTPQVNSAQQMTGIQQEDSVQQTDNVQITDRTQVTDTDHLKAIDHLKTSDHLQNNNLELAQGSEVRESDSSISTSDTSVSDTMVENDEVMLSQDTEALQHAVSLQSAEQAVLDTDVSELSAGAGKAEEKTQPKEQDKDSLAFQELVSKAQQNMAATQNPFLVQQDQNLPVPTSPMPTLELLYHPERRDNHIDRAALEDIARLVETKLEDYKIKARVVDIFPGPVITRFELDLAPGVKVSRISGLSMDLARSLSAMAVRVVEVIPGKPYVGLELPNMSRQTVYFSDVVGSKIFREAKSPTTVVMGQDIAGEAVIADIAKMPHVLVAGTTGSGKSVGVNVMILSMLYKARPEDLRFIMIDPKMLELSVYEGIPHLLSEVVTDMKDASNALRWCVGEMERRYKLMSALGVRNVKGFNDKLKMAADAGHPIYDPLWQPGDSMDEMPPLLEKLPYIVVVVDEFADLMMVVGKKVEELIARLAQKARAAGIHLILATQRPSVDVITGLIKANIPTRVAFTVSTKTDSRTILDQGGAESLLGMGDMLYLPPGSSHTVRVHGAFASDDDVHAVVNDWKARGKPNYIDEITNGEQTPDTLLPGESMEGDEEVDPLFDQVVEHVVQSRRGSVSGVQRRFKIGYNRAARIVEQLEAQGIVSAPGHNGNREVLAPAPLQE